MEQTITIVIPEGLVPLRRDGFYLDGHLEEAGSLIEPRNRADLDTEVSAEERTIAKAHISQLADLIAQDAAPTDILSGAPVTAETTLRLMRLVNDLKDRRPEAVDELKAVASQDFDGYFNIKNNAAIDVLNLLMVAAARSDPDARKRLVAAYNALMDNYSGLENALLTAIGREPIPALVSMRNFAAIITALYDGLAIRARMGESENARRSYKPCCSRSSPRSPCRSAPRHPPRPRCFSATTRADLGEHVKLTRRADRW